MNISVICIVRKRKGPDLHISYGKCRARFNLKEPFPRRRLPHCMECFGASVNSRGRRLFSDHLQAFHVVGMLVGDENSVYVLRRKPHLGKAFDYPLSRRPHVYQDRRLFGLQYVTVAAASAGGRKKFKWHISVVLLYKIAGDKAVSRLYFSRHFGSRRKS